MRPKKPSRKLLARENKNKLVNVIWKGLDNGKGIHAAGDAVVGAKGFATVHFHPQGDGGARTSTVTAHLVEKQTPMFLAETGLAVLRLEAAAHQDHHPHQHLVPLLAPPHRHHAPDVPAEGLETGAGGARGTDRGLLIYVIPGAKEEPSLVLKMDVQGGPHPIPRRLARYLQSDGDARLSVAPIVILLPLLPVIANADHLDVQYPDPLPDPGRGRGHGQKADGVAAGELNGDDRLHMTVAAVAAAAMPALIATVKLAAAAVAAREVEKIEEDTTPSRDMRQPPEDTTRALQNPHLPVSGRNWLTRKKNPREVHPNLPLTQKIRKIMMIKLGFQPMTRWVNVALVMITYLTSLSTTLPIFLLPFFFKMDIFA